MFRGGREVESRTALARNFNFVSLFLGQHDASSIFNMESGAIESNVHRRLVWSIDAQLIGKDVTSIEDDFFKK
jgi:hypothetical protein